MLVFSTRKAADFQGGVLGATMKPSGRCRVCSPPWCLLFTTGADQVERRKPSRTSRMPSPSWSFFVITAALCLLAAGGAHAQAVTSGDADAPSLVILPSSAVQTKPEGRNALLTCRPQGIGASLVTGLRWRAPDGREVPQPTPSTVSRPPVYAERFSSDGSLSLIFQSLMRTDEGSYTCEGQYAGGQDLARSVEIRVIKAIRWVEAPTEQYARLGKDFKVMCKVEAEPPATVDWTKDGKQLDERYRQETDGLMISKVSPEDDGIYTCRAIVVSTGELQLRPIKVQVQVPPTFAEESRNATIKANHDETLECNAEGRPPPEYKWIFASTGQDLVKEGGRFQVNSITGALHISPVRAEDDGTYWCIARNDADESRQRVHVSVHVPPRVTLVRNATAAAGTASELRCEARGRPLPNVGWRRHGEEQLLAPGQQATEKRISTSSRPAGREHPDRSDGILSWDEVQRSDDGLYACVAKNDAGVAEAFGHLTVEFGPSFENTPYSEYWSWDGKLANITCLAESIPNATIRWFYNNRDIEKEKLTTNFKKFGEGPQSWLAINPDYTARYATYKCLAKNKIDEAEHEIVLHKASIPGAIMQAVFDVVTATTIKFKIVGPSESGGIPTRLYTVRYRNPDILGDQWKTHTWTAESDYTLIDLQPLTRYEFQFSAKNDVGEGPWSATLSKVMPKRSPPEPPPLLDRVPMSAHPDKPMDTPVTSVYPTHFELRWNIPADNGEPIKSYFLTWCPARRSNEGHWEQDMRSSSCEKRDLLFTVHTTSYRLQPLQPGLQYVVHLHAINRIGMSNASMLLLKTAPDHSKGPYDEMSTSSASFCSPALALLLLGLVSLLLLLLLPALPTAPH